MSGGKHEYIIEFTTVGNSVKVTAIDPVSLKEVSCVGPTNATREQLSELAIRKLLYVLRKKS